MIPVSRAVVEREPLGRDRASLREAITHRLVYSVGKDPLAATSRDWLHATALAVRDRLVEGWMHTSRAQADAKRVYYLSLEFLTGRLLSNSLQNIGLDLALRGALADLEVELDLI